MKEAVACHRRHSPGVELAAVSARTAPMGEPSSTGAPSSVATASSSVRAGFSKKRAGLRKKIALDGKNYTACRTPRGGWGAVGRSRDTQKTPWGVVGRSRGTRVAGHRRQACARRGQAHRTSRHEVSLHPSAPRGADGGADLELARAPRLIITFDCV